MPNRFSRAEKWREALLPIALHDGDVGLLARQVVVSGLFLAFGVALYRNWNMIGTWTDDQHTQRRMRFQRIASASCRRRARPRSVGSIWLGK
ncbi:hypothetical protein SAMN04487950_0419 [Halogranum rubrum]|uniref:DUF8073 domain-containing protein n=1 Tax=Halogranum rubrum TaxID=553466 RepID=A0A1I4BC87_9EURY|nr:hypothetical protein SAMN04487950_0419 [Halogranum rubrum]